MQRAFRLLRRGRTAHRPLDVRVQLDPNYFDELASLAAAAGVSVEGMAKQVIVNDLLRRQPPSQRRALTVVSS